MNKIIYILNYWWTNNYGASLTSFALNQIVQNSNIIDNSTLSKDLVLIKLFKYVKTKLKRGLYNV